MICLTISLSKLIEPVIGIRFTFTTDCKVVNYLHCHHRNLHDNHRVNRDLFGLLGLNDQFNAKLRILFMQDDF